MSIAEAPTALHRGETDLPFVDLGDTGLLQLLQVDLANGVWVVRNRFNPGGTVQTHKHTGHVYAFTQSGSWHYLESPEAVNVAGSYLYEPAGSTHTLHVPASNTEVTDVWFTIHGANLNLGADGQVEMVIDAHTILPVYRLMCAEQHGIDDPPVIVIDTLRPMTLCSAADVEVAPREPSPRSRPTVTRWCAASPPPRARRGRTDHRAARRGARLRQAADGGARHLRQGVPPVVQPVARRPGRRRLRALASLRAGRRHACRLRGRAAVPRPGAVQGAVRRAHAVAPGPVLLALRGRPHHHDVDADGRRPGRDRHDDLRLREPPRPLAAGPGISDESQATFAEQLRASGLPLAHARRAGGRRRHLPRRAGPCTRRPATPPTRCAR